LSDAAAPLVQRMRQLTTLPLALGFGISTPEQVAEAAKSVDAVVVGSALVKFIETNAGRPDLADKLASFTQTLTAPLKTS
jgi:tryptophan synthase alpha chain